MEINLTVEIKKDELIESITNELNYDELIDFIKKIDYSISDWDFTLEIYEHFKQLKKVYDKEVEKD